MAEGWGSVWDAGPTFSHSWLDVTWITCLQIHSKQSVRQHTRQQTDHHKLTVSTLWTQGQAWNKLKWVNIALRRFLHNHGTIATGGSPKSRLMPYSYRMTSRVLYSAQYHRQHYTLHAFEQFGAPLKLVEECFDTLLTWCHCPCCGTHDITFAKSTSGTLLNIIIVG